jgi:tetratricopeptide (TPR) repeat protein
MLAFCAVALVVAASPKPHADPQAIQDAVRSGQQPDKVYPSASSYSHFLASRLAQHQGDGERALTELRLAMLSNEASPYLMTELGEQLARSGSMQRAEVALEKAVGKHPHHAPAHLLLGRVLAENGKMAKAQTHLKKVMSLTPQNIEAYLVLSQLQLDLGQTDEAMATVVRLGDAIPGEPIGYRRLGLLLAERDDKPRATKMLLAAVERDPADAETAMALARILETTGKPAQAAGVLDNVIEHRGEDKEVLLTAGRLALGRKALDAARAHFGQALSAGLDAETVVRISMLYLANGHRLQSVSTLDDSRHKLDDPRLHFYAGLVHERLRNLKSALSAFESAAKSSGGKSIQGDIDLHRGECLSQLGQHRTALELLGKLAHDQPDAAEPATTYARALERAGKVAEAEATLRPLLVPRAGPKVYSAVSQFFIRQGRTSEVVRLFSQALQDGPSDAPLTLALAVALESDGQWKEAINTVKGLIRKPETSAVAMNFTAYTLAEHGENLEEAERLVQLALVQRPESPAFLDTLGWVHYKKKEYGKAIALLERALEQAQDEVTMSEHLADVYAESGDLPAAKTHYTRILELLKKFPEAAERKNQRQDIERKTRALGSR